MLERQRGLGEKVRQLIMKTLCFISRSDIDCLMIFSNLRSISLSLPTFKMELIIPISYRNDKNKICQKAL